MQLRYQQLTKISINSYYHTLLFTLLLGGVGGLFLISSSIKLKGPIYTLLLFLVKGLAPSFISSKGNQLAILVLGPMNLGVISQFFLIKRTDALFLCFPR